MSIGADPERIVRIKQPSLVDNNNSNQEVVKVYVTSVFDNKYNLKKIASEVWKLPEQEREAFFKVWSEETLERIRTTSELSSSDRNLYYQGINKMRKRLYLSDRNNNKEEEKKDMKTKTQSKIKKATELFGGKYSKEEIILAAAKLSPEDKRIFFKKWNNELKQNEQLTPKEGSKYYATTLRNLEKCLHDPSYVPRGSSSSAKGVKKKKPKMALAIFNETDSVEQVKMAINKLTAVHQEIFYKLWNEETLEQKCKTTDLTSAEKSTYYHTVLPTIKRCISDPQYVPYGTAKKEEKSQESKSKRKKVNKESTKVSSNPTVDDKQNAPKEIAQNNEVDEFTKCDYISMSNLFTSPTFDVLKEKLDPKAAVIVSLKLGFVDGKCFSTEAIHNFLGIDKEEITSITKNVLLQYREETIKQIDNTIDTVINDKGFIKIK